MLGQEVMSNDVEGMNVNMNLSELNSSIYIVNVEGVITLQIPLRLSLNNLE